MRTLEVSSFVSNEYIYGTASAAEGSLFRFYAKEHSTKEIFVHL